MADFHGIADFGKKIQGGVVPSSNIAAIKAIEVKLKQQLAIQLPKDMRGMSAHEVARALASGLRNAISGTGLSKPRTRTRYSVK